MGKTSVEQFDPDVCMGRRRDVDGRCPHLEDIDADTGRGVVDRLARVESAAMRATGVAQNRDESEFKCGACGCPLVNLHLTDFAPDNCPRLDKHQ